MSPTATQDSRIPTWAEWLSAIVINCFLSALVWRGILLGGGLVGGDTYPYFFPQKQIVAEAFSRGEIPLWHDRTSLGYPLHAESQAGVFYPTNQILYRVFDVHTAYHGSLLLHYALAGVFAWRVCRCQSLSHSSALLASMVFVYGWFPVRVSLEWSIIGGVWFPLCLWMTDRLLQRPSLQRWIGLTCCLGLHLLAGHFTLAFITQLTCIAYAFFSSPGRGQKSGQQTAPQSIPQNNVANHPAPTAGSESGRGHHRWQATVWIFASIAASGLLSAVQLMPTLELQRLSQRDGEHSAFNPADGHMPPMYLTQLVASWWYWHTPEVAVSRETLKHPFLISSGDTNPVEAHLYLGLIPFFLLLGLSSGNVRRTLRATRWKLWLGMSLAAVIYAFGWLIPLTRHLPGFGFFIGPGRYTIVTTLGLAIIAGLVLDALFRRRRGWVRISFTIVIAVITLADVLKSAEFPVCNAQVVATPPLDGLRDSWLARTLQEEDKRSPVRLLAGGPNVGNLFGVSSVPQYLGLGPAEYFTDDAMVETHPTSADAVFPSATQLARLDSLAVTHILTTEAVLNVSDQCELVASGPDSFLNRVWGRGQADCYLYRLRNATGRVSSKPATALSRLTFLKRHSGDVRFTVTLSEAAEVRLNDLMFPGWNVSVGDKREQALSSSGFGRRVKLESGTHEVRWVYQPWSFRIGVFTSLLTVIVMAAALVWRRIRS